MRPLGLLTVASVVIGILLVHSCASTRATKLLSNSINAERTQAARPNPFFND